MTKYLKPIQTLAALLIAVAAMTACSSENTITDETIITPDAPKTYTMTVQASKGDAATTRALSIDGTGALNAKWTAGDMVTVMKYHSAEWKVVGQLEATNISADGHSCTLTGDLDATMMAAAGYLTAGDKLRLVFPGGTLNSSYSMNYTGQNGILDKIATDFDYCSTPSNTSTPVQVKTVSGNSITTDNATFTNNQAIVCFTLTDKNGNPINPTSLTISAKDGASEELILSQQLTGAAISPSKGVLTITPSGTTNEVYVALRGFSNMNITLKAIAANGEYSYTKTGVTFTDGKYYTIAVKMKNDLVNLGDLTDDYIAQDGDILTGTLPSGKHLSIAEGATVTLKNVTISDASQAGITCLGNANIIISGTNNVKSTADNSPGIQAGGSSTTLTIGGSGSLTAQGGPSGAGIGCGSGSCGNIEISGGTVKATGGAGAAGIGSGYNSGYVSSCGTITISGGTVTATGGAGGAGIGTGVKGFPCGNITISGGEVNATGGYGAAGIGSGNDKSSCSDILISGGTVTATGGLEAAGIGSGAESGSTSSCGNIAIENTVTLTQVTAIKGSNAPNSIGKGYNSAAMGIIKFGSTQVYNGSVWSPNPMVAGAYGGLTLNITKTNYDDDTWTLIKTPTTP